MTNSRAPLPREQMIVMEQLALKGVGPSIVAEALEKNTMSISMYMRRHPRYDEFVAAGAAKAIEIYVSDPRMNLTELRFKTGWSHVTLNRWLKDAGVLRNPGGPRADGKPNAFGTGKTADKKRPEPEIPREENPINKALTMRWG